MSFQQAKPPATGKPPARPIPPKNPAPGAPGAAQPAVSPRGKQALPAIPPSERVASPPTSSGPTDAPTSPPLPSRNYQPNVTQADPGRNLTPAVIAPMMTSPRPQMQTGSTRQGAAAPAPAVSSPAPSYKAPAVSAPKPAPVTMIKPAPVSAPPPKKVFDDDEDDFTPVSKPAPSYKAPTASAPSAAPAAPRVAVSADPWAKFNALDLDEALEEDADLIATEEQMAAERAPALPNRSHQNQPTAPKVEVQDSFSRMKASDVPDDEVIVAIREKARGNETKGAPQTEIERELASMPQAKPRHVPGVTKEPPKDLLIPMKECANKDPPDLEGVLYHLVKSGADPDVKWKNKNGMTLLHLFSMTPNIRVLDMIMRFDAPLNACDNKGMTPLHLAVEANQIANVKHFLAQKNILVDVEDAQGQTALSIATKMNNYPLFEMLVQKGAKVDHRDSTGRLIIHHASALGNKDMIELLIGYGAIIDVEDSSLNTPLLLAESKGHHEIAAYMKKAGGKSNIANKFGSNVLLGATFAQSKERVEFWLDHGCDIDEQFTSLKNTVLHQIMLQLEDPHLKQCLLLLLECGAPINCTNGELKTPLHLAVYKNQFDTAKYLICCQADVNALDICDNTPLHFVRSQEMAGLLLQNGARIHAKNKHGNTPLHVICAFLEDSDELQRFMISKGADNLARNIHGMTPQDTMNPNIEKKFCMPIFPGDPQIKEAGGINIGGVPTSITYKTADQSQQVKKKLDKKMSILGSGLKSFSKKMEKELTALNNAGTHSLRK